MEILQPEQGWIRQPTTLDGTMQQQGLVFSTLSNVAKFFDKQQVPRIFKSLHIHKKLFWFWLPFASQLMPYGKLDAHLREQIILRTAWNYRCRYEWAQHVLMSLHIGLSDQHIVDCSKPLDALSGKVKLLMQACDEMCQQKYISTAIWQQLAQDYDEVLLIEISMLIGHYGMLAGFLNTTGLVVEDENEKKLQAFLSRVEKIASH